jgi:hypothetical protein
MHGLRLAYGTAKVPVASQAEIDPVASGMLPVCRAGTFEIFIDPTNVSNHKALEWWARQGSNL